MSTHEVVLIRCPESGERLVAAKVWESRLPNGQKIVYGQFKLHHHWQGECPWSYLAVEVDSPVS
jgi:hypothetical protein